jgi:TLD.
LILVKHVAKEEDLKYNPDQPKECIFGGFAVSEWSDELGYQGESESYVFSLYPKFKAFYTHKGEGGTNYRYLNTKKIQNSKYKVGLGNLGKPKVESYRIWWSGFQEL